MLSIGAMAPLKWVSLAAAGLIAAVALLALRLGRARRSARAVPTWDCGYARPTSRMQYTASSFARSLVGMFSWAIHPKSEPARIEGAFPLPERLRGEVEEAVLDRALLPAGRRVKGLSQWLHRFQQGLTQQYVLYILVALAVLLVTLVPFDKILAMLAAG